MKSICLLFLAVLLISMTFAKGPGGHGGSGDQSSTRPDIATIIASLSTDEQTYVTCIADFLVSSLTFDSTAAKASALAYMRYYQENSTLTPTDTSTCGTTVPTHTVTAVSP